MRFIILAVLAFLAACIGDTGTVFVGRGVKANLTQTHLAEAGRLVSTSLPAPERAASGEEFLDSVAEDTWNYLSSDWATSNHLPWSWRAANSTDGNYANPAEIGLYMLSWIAAYDLQSAWSPAWPAAETEVEAVLDQLRAWQTGSQAYQPHGPNAFGNSVFYQWYWIAWDPPVVGADSGLNHLVPSVDNAWLAASLITVREYAEAHAHASLAQKADAIVQDMDFSLWFDPNTHLFTWGGVEDPQGGGPADYYSNENRIINFIARALGDIEADEFALSLAALQQNGAAYGGISVEKVAWDGSYFTYAAPALFIREMQTEYGSDTISPATQAQILYAQDQGYDAWGLSDCYDVGLGPYVQQGAPPVAMPDPPETRPGLVTPHASALALITPYHTEVITNLQIISGTFAGLYDPLYGFHDSVMADPGAPDYGQVSDRFVALDQAWLFLAIINYKTGFIWEYFYRDAGVFTAHQEMFATSRAYLPLVSRGGALLGGE